MRVSFYDETGRFTQTLEGDLDLVVTPTAQELSLPYIEGEYGEEYWFHDGAPQLRPVSPVTLDGTTLHNVPANSTITINDTDYEATGPDVALDLAGAVEYQITVRCWPYLDWQTTMTEA